ncbi:hypothetical protein CH251_25940 [Rhodococcus sp. 06-462-5]|uniref:hypothetical protein n=1 Tax=Nocardiaceae TaxID=85025 RepID=UPI00050C5C35|nr:MULTISPECIES: hypothetical protein [Rhodococcus]OZC47865.1 hypothetical protein CH267_26515 [Rhodococcus sp. 06-621-2]OZC60714.1 hypothetical protein CH277_27050 [Rhodococcus sp. 06-469-3-2]OZC64135.1 hypothetical protein CH251_25940 [Rhodococcus sp. 06-462-5]OZD74446.1 hypothetical protein CH263_00740 [Rhodococcus sp. 06-1059B-a]OZE57975.1 hypothetical protein CH270_25655 [Rhodococcus sp. 02-925g]
MTKKRDEDTIAIDAAIEHLQDASGRTPSVLALARHMGLANTTFRRRYPHTVNRLKRSTSPVTDHVAPHRCSDEVTQIRQRNRDLTTDLELAVASIQRLSIDNRSLLRRVEELSNVTHLRTTD